MQKKSLRKKTVSSMVWTAINKYSHMFVTFISGIVLARLLTPYDYGCIGMLSIFMLLSETFIDGGFGAALIQKKAPTQEDYSTIFFWNVGVSLLLYLVLFLSAPAIAVFYNTPLLCPVLRVQGVVIIIYAFNLVQKNLLRKNMNFKVLSIITMVTSVVAMGITIWMAYSGFGVWALVAQNIITALIPCLVFWFYIKWRPIWVFSIQSFKELFGFGFYMFLAHLINTFSGQLQGLLIGKVYTPTTMGYYSKAHGTEKLASTSISQVMTQVTYPLYAAVQDDKASLGNIIKRMTMTLSYVTFPMMFILILLAEPLFILLYSDKWINSVPYFQVLCIAGLPNCLQAVNFQAISAIGKSRVMFRWTFIKRFIGIGAVVGGLALFGMKGLLGGLIINSWFSYIVNIGLVSKHIGYKWTRQLKDLSSVAMVSACIGLICYFIQQFFDMNMYAEGGIVLIVYMILYMGWSI